MEFDIGEIIVDEEINIEDIELDVMKEYPELEDLIITPSNSEQKFKSSKYGYNNVIIEAIESEELSIIPSSENQVIEGIFNKVTVQGDSNLIPENIKKGTTIFGINGTANVSDVEITDTRYLFYKNIRINQLNEILNICRNVINASYMFNECDQLKSLELNNFDTSNVTTMSRMFDGCSGLINLDVTNLDTSNVTSMNTMFGSCRSLENLDISNFNVKNVLDVSSMFNSCSSLKNLNLGSFNAKKCSSFSGMFASCSQLSELNLNNFNTSSGTKMDSMFNGCSGLTNLNLSSFDTSNVTNMFHMFYGCKNLINLDISSFDTSNVIGVSYMFQNCNSLTNLNFCTNLGKGYKQKTNNYSSYKLDLSYSTLLTHESLMSVINNLYDLNLAYNVAGGGTLYRQGLVLGSTNLAKLTEEEIAIATDKGWNVT